MSTCVKTRSQGIKMSESGRSCKTKIYNKLKAEKYREGIQK